MGRSRKSIIFVIIPAIPVLLAALFIGYTKPSFGDPVRAPQGIFAKLKDKSAEARELCLEKGMDTNYCILVDFGIHSGRKRMFVWDFNTDTVALSSLCAHGYGLESTTTKPVFSNVEGSYCSSLGKYKIGDRSWSKWGINVHYKLHGLEETNDNAFKRIVVLHSHDLIPENDIYPMHLPLGFSQGCPVISNGAMRNIDELLKDSKKPFLLWVYY